MRDRKRVKRKIRKERAKQRIRELMRKNEISPEELRDSKPQQQSRPRKSGFPREEQEENEGSINPIGRKIRKFRSWLRRMQNTPSVTKGSSEAVSSVFKDVFGRR